ncbi:MAG: toll/interleukin-1 receptor domain-containing protein [Bacteroidota bacterium]
MKNIWISYAWADNEQQDVDFIAQELKVAGVSIKLDRWNIAAGNRLWPQIEKFITSPEESDSWVLIATQNSLSSEACKEEFAYALDRALSVRGGNFPIIGLFLGPVDKGLIPVGIKTRLYVSITDPDWKERIIAATEGRLNRLVEEITQPYFLKVHYPIGPDYNNPIAIEVRPRAGVWHPFIAAILNTEKEHVQPHIFSGPKDMPTDWGMLVDVGSSVSDNGSFWLMFAGNQATPYTSYYIWCNHLPSKIIFGSRSAPTLFEYTF